MKIMVTGACGQLGRSLRDVLREEPGMEAVFTDIVLDPDAPTVLLDMTDEAAVRALADAEGVEAIVNCAAYTAVDGAEDHPELAERLNATAVAGLARVMRDRGGLLVHISTDYVFGGDPYNTPCGEDRRSTPTGVYGLTKLHGEEAVLRSGVRYIIFRTAWLYSEYGRNFVRTMLRLTAERPVLRVVFDQAGTPTYAGDLARAIVLALRRAPGDGADVCGIYHYSNEGVCSWYDFARVIADMAGHRDCRILPCHSAEYPSKVRRPAYSVLDKTRFKETFRVEIPYWMDSLRTCIARLKEMSE